MASTKKKEVGAKRAKAQTKKAEVVETAASQPVPQKEAPKPESQAAKPGSEKKPKVTKAKTAEKEKQPVPGSIASVRDAFFSFLAEKGNSRRTIYTYRKDLELFERFFGPNKPVAEIAESHVRDFTESPICTTVNGLPDGRERALPTVNKTKRLVRIFLEWLVATGKLKQSPIPRDLRMGSKSVEERERTAKTKPKKKGKSSDTRKADSKPETAAKAS